MKIYALVRSIDVETTGLKGPPENGVVELGWRDTYATALDGNRRPSKWVVDSGGPYSCYVNPGHPIPYEAQAIHHIGDADVKDASPLSVAWAEMASTFPAGWHAAVPTAYAAHYAAAERAYVETMTAGVDWICTWRCAKHQWPHLVDFSNQAVRYFLQPRGLKTGRAFPPHRAGPDAYVTAHHVRELLNLGHTVERLVEGTNTPPLLQICTLGKMAGKRWEEVDSGFLRWLLEPVRRDGFDEDVIFTARFHLQQRSEEK